MKSLSIILLYLLMIPFNVSNDQVKVISFNIRYGKADDGSNSWIYRKNILFDFIRKENADFLGLQEAMIFQLEEILKNCPEYQYVGRTREADGISGEATPILYRKSDYELIDQGSLWLSDTPEVPASKSWDSALPRIFTWARFRRKKDLKNLIVYNTHFDHLGEQARFQSSKVIIDHMHQHFRNDDMILLGDFNALEISEPIEYLAGNHTVPLRDAYRKLHPGKKEQDMTFYGWGEHTAGSGKRIDYVFYAGSMEPQQAYVSDYHVDLKYPSDHMPVVVTFKW